MKPIYTFLIPLGLCFILSGLLAETTYSLSIGRTNINQQKTITPAAPTGDPIQAICQGSRALSDPNFTEIDINAESGASISWYTSLSSTSAIPINSILPVGDNTYYISQTVNGIESADRLEVRVLIPDLYLTGNSEICPGTSTSITFNYNSLGVQGNVQSFSWTTGETSETINVTPPTSNFPTTYEVNYVYDSGLGINNLYCKVSKDIYSRDLDDPVADASTLANVTAQCSVTSLTAPTATDNCAGSVTVTNNASLPITTQGTTVVTWTFEDANGNTTTEDQNVVINDTTAPVADASSLADVTAQCSVTSLTAPTATDNCAGSVTVTNNASLPITTQGTTVVTWTFDDGNGNTTTQDQNIIIEYVDDIDALDEDYFICNDSNGGGLEYLLIDPGLIGPDYEFVWLDEFGNILSQQPTYEITQEGGYSLEIYYSSCPATIEFFTVTEIDAPTATVDIITGDFSTNNIIEVNATSLGTYEYSLDGGGWQDNNTFINVAGGTHTINIKDVRGCGITSYIINLIDYPRFFTPNGDGYNDNWNIKTLSAQRDATIYIFDRYGKIIKQIWPSGNGWDGTYNGQEMPTNDYWFLLNYNDTVTGEPKQFRAHFTLRR